MKKKMKKKSPPSQKHRDELRARNMDAFKSHYLQLANRLASHIPASKIVFDKNGQPDIEFEGQKFYNGDHDDFIKKQLIKQKSNPYRLGLAPPQPAKFDTVNKIFLESILTKSIKDADITFSKNKDTIESFFVTILGIGLGMHIDRIVEFSKCNTIIFVDPNIENLYHSLEIYDWAQLFEQQKEKRGSVKFLITNDPVEVFQKLIFFIRTINAPSVDGMLVYLHYNHALFNATYEQIRQKGNLCLAGLGFMADEVKMIENTHENLSRGTAHIYEQRQSRLITTPCFIVGCGPSLDQDLPYIKKHADNAIVFSSGSALGPLLNAGVIPDFQIEVENEGILPIMQHVSELHDISNICLVTSTTVECEIVNYFKNIIYHFRPSLSPYAIFSNDWKNTIPFHDPSVVNSSLGFAQDLGFREFFMFGCDMGTRDAEQHHAKNSYHFSPNAKLPSNDFCIPIPANFGGNTHTSNGLFEVKTAIENAISANREGRTYNNCTDGAYIKGTLPKFSNKIQLLKLKQGKKAELVADVMSHCPIMSRDKFESHWQTDKIQDTIDEYINEMKAIVEYADFLHEDSHMIDFNDLFFKPTSALKAGVITFFRGSMQMILIAGLYYAHRVKSHKKQDEFEEILREELLLSLEVMHETTSDLVLRLASPSP